MNVITPLSDLDAASSSASSPGSVVANGDAASRAPTLALAALVALAALLVFPFGATPLAPVPGFMPAFGGMVMVVDLLTATLLLSQARVIHDKRIARLGLAYAVAVMTIAPHLLAFPGVFAAQPVIGGSASAVWLWCLWHGGFAACVCRYALTARQPSVGRIRLLPSLTRAAAVVAVLTLVATAGLHWLPDILVGGDFSRLNRIGVGPAVIATNMVALALTLRLRGRSTLDAWLAVAMLAATLDVLLTLFSGGRFTLGWYVARCLSLATGVIVLIALLSELTVLFSRQSAVNRQLRQMSMTDSLTHLSNRRGFDERLAAEWRRMLRDGSALSLAVVDIDWFKGYNDRYGHPGGDRCLHDVSRAFEAVGRRGTDVVARLGGEEFAVLMPATDEDGAARVATAIHAALRQLAIVHEGSPLGRVTVSVGVATCRAGAGMTQPGILMASADEALYEAKQEGRNRSSVAESLGPAPRAELVIDP